MKVFQNLIKYTIGLPLILVLTIVFILVYLECFLFDTIVYGDSTPSNILLELIIDLWRPIQ